MKFLLNQPINNKLRDNSLWNPWEGVYKRKIRLYINPSLDHHLQAVLLSSSFEMQRIIAISIINSQIK